MKKILSIAVLLISLSVSAQGNLQFNQVINGTLTANVLSTGSTMGTIVVPAGKVLKIESVAFTYPSPTIPAPHVSSAATVFINDHTVLLNVSSASQVTLPLWLSAGTYNVNARVGANQLSTFSYSAIEFNVVP